MCLNPILRPNTSYRVPGSALSARINMVARAFGKDADNKYIYVPCGHCPDCVRARQNSLVQRADIESRYNHIFFATLTYNNAHLPILTVEVPRDFSSLSDSSLFNQEPSNSFSVDDAEEALASETFDYSHVQSEAACGSYLELADFYKEVDFPFADIHHVQLLLKNLRDNLSRYDVFKGRSIKYLAVSELGKTFGRPHFHILFFVSKLPGDYLVTSLSGLKYVGSSFLKTGVIRDLEKCLWDNVFKYWAVNVGTRKNPVYEPLFTFRKRFCGNKVNTNFDLHYVDPSLTTEGTANVSYYVTKYILKGSELEERRQRFLHLNLSESNYRSVWNVIKCRMLISKGFGVNGKCVTVVDDDLPKFNVLRYAEIMCSDDFPDDDASFYDSPCSRRRIMIPDSNVLSSLHSDVCKDVGRSPFPIFIDSLGVHRPLGRYFYRFSQVFSLSDFYDIYYNYDDSSDTPRWELSKVQKDDVISKFDIILDRIECNSTFDTSLALLYPGDQDSNIHLNPLNHVQS